MDPVKLAKTHLSDILESPKFENVSRVVIEAVDVDAERGFTSVIMHRGRKRVVGYAKRHTGEGQREDIGVRLAVLDGIRRLVGVDR